MRTSRFAVVLLLLCFGLSLAVPADDVPETGYNESEALPYEGTPVFSIAVPLAAARATQVVPNSLHHILGAPSRLPSARVGDAHRSADVSLALLCTLLC